MSFLRPPERVPFRPGDSAGDLRRWPGKRRLEVVLSNRLTRYALLPWSPALRNEAEWLGFARHVLAATYGPEAGAWAVCVGGAGRGKARVACAMDQPLLDALAAVERVVSVQPHLMAAFNARRAEFAAEPGWLVIHEPGRIAVGLVAGGDWKILRNRQVPEKWRDALPALLHRETAVAGLPPCERVVLASELAA